MKLPRRKVITASCVATLAAGALAGAALPTTASAAGAQSTYIVLAPQGQSTQRAAARVTAAGGTVVANYTQIGVLVARSANPGFETAVAGSGVEAVASTAGLGTALEDSTTIEATDVTAVSAPGDPTGEPLFGLQWDMVQIDVPQAHAVTTGSANVVVGVLDSGISSTHPDLATQIAKDKSVSCIGGVTDVSEAAWNPTTSDHGTHVAGTIAAAVNGIGVAGVAPGVKVASVKVVNDDGFIYPEAAVCGFLWAADHGMQVTNNSYYIDPWEFNCRNDARQRPVWLAVQRAIRYSQSKGVLNVASAGNSNVDLQHKFTDSTSPNDGSYPVEDRTITGACVDLPAEAPGVVTVSATGPTRMKSYYSSYGQGVVDVAAPGGDTRFRNLGTPSTLSDGILSTTFNTTTKTNGWGYKQGTSMAGPHVAGVAALALSAHPGLQPGALASSLERTAEALPCPTGVYNPVPKLAGFEATCTGGNRNGFYGAGEVNAYNAVR
ncbi:S8 family serine peptidase [Dactylosporangium sp. AC04546]|uniref:S8 family peptidase n=1 Tax=Dactylosporangium sp. AC04546 TaxID=2862460 RepID=UPI0027DF372F|nr:S8 family serine peptidase [Dactylosporangium sp. AC04546]WVK87295.1 S8 family serine peptidase [Dactylosporangium sp. AC04546]